MPKRGTHPLLGRLLGALFAALALVCAPVSWSDTANGQEVIAPDPELRVETLDNGMRVWVRPNQEPPGRVHLLLRIATGSLNEDEGERGLAHLLEHLAFQGSANFPRGTMFSRFEKIGLRPGAHQNASTGFEHTTYTLTLPNARTETLEQGLLALSDMAYRLELSQEALDTERDVVLEEERLHQGPERRIRERMYAFLLEDSRLPSRIPIGTEASLRAITLPAVQGFYRRWYRPDKAALIVAGDVAPETVLPLVRAQFDGWKKPDESAPDADTSIGLYRDSRALVVTEPETVRARVKFARLVSEPSSYTMSDLRRTIIREIAMGAIDRRLYQLTIDRQLAAESADFSRSTLISPVRSIDWTVSGKPENWREMLKFVIEEQKRLRKHGLREEEIEEQRRETIANGEATLRRLETQRSGALISWLADNLDEDTLPPARRRLYELSRPVVSEITTGEVNAAVRALMAQSAQRIVVVLPRREQLAVPTAEQVLSVAKAAERNGVAKSSARRDLQALLAHEPTPGKIAQRTHDRDLRVTSLVFENGVRLHLRPMSEQKDTVEFVIQIAGGEIEETAQNRGISFSAFMGLLYPATSRLSPSEFERMISGRNIIPMSFTQGGHTHITVSTVPADLEEALRVGHALLTDARVDERVLQRWLDATRDAPERRRYSVASQVGLAANRLFTGADPRFNPIEPATAERFGRDGAQAWLDRVLRETPIEVAIAGDFLLEDAVALAEKYLGSLPKRPPSSPELEAKSRVRIVPGPHEESVTAETQTPRAEVYLAWRGADWRDTHDRRALHLAARVLDRKLTQALREQRGWVYALDCRSDAASDYAGNGRFIVRFSTDPGQAQDAVQLARRIVEEMAADGPTEEELAIVRGQLANEHEVSLRHTRYWLGWLAGMSARGDTLDGLREEPAALDHMTATEVRDVLARYITPERRVTIIGTPQGSAVAESLGLTGGVTGGK